MEIAKVTLLETTLKVKQVKTTKTLLMKLIIHFPKLV